MNQVYRKTKIVCTMGPSTDDDDIVRRMMLAGMNVARLNFSHGTHESHGKTINRIKQLRKELNLPVAIMLDIKGPEIRLKSFVGGQAVLVKGQQFTLCTVDALGDNMQVAVSYDRLPQDVCPGDTILIDDGLISMTVEEVTGSCVHCVVDNDGVISNNKSVNVPCVSLSLPYLSTKDHDDIVFGIQNGVDFIAASFTRNAADIQQIRDILSEQACSSIDVIAKVENMQGIENIDEILQISDGIMIARGDLGVEIPLEEVPVAQKLLIQKACGCGKTVITATQMLDSMETRPRPTRAEVTDVANAVYDGTSAVMLSGETAIGLYPVEALQTMARITQRTERDINYFKRLKQQITEPNPDVTSAISYATCTSAHDLGAAAILTLTKSGRTARMISRYRPDCPILGCTTEESVYRQLSLDWGVLPLAIEEAQDTDELLERAVEASEKAGCLCTGELVVMTAGVPLGVSGTTNMMKVQVVAR